MINRKENYKRKTIKENYKRDETLSSSEIRIVRFRKIVIRSHWLPSLFLR